jgi:hypothetical protein
MADYIRPADTAKLVRAALKESFPGVKFSVRTDTYSGGASIHVGWTDGPNTKQVESITDVFSGSYFDGMIDYKGSRYALFDGRRVNFGANFIFCRREHSDESVFRVMRRLKTDATVESFRNGSLYSVPFAHVNAQGANDLQGVINTILSKRTDRLRVEHSKTLDRVRYAGDDGYSASQMAQGANIRAV